ELHSPTLKISTCGPSTLHITQNTEQELHSPTVKVTTYPQTTIRKYVVQNPEQEPLSQFLRGSHFFPGNNVIYEKTIRKVEKLNTDQECHPQAQCHHHIVHQPQVIHSAHWQQPDSSQQIQAITGNDPISTHIGNELCHSGSSQICEQVIIQDDGPEKLDPRYFGELLADLSRKNTDLYRCLLEHLQRIGGSLENDKMRLEKDLSFKETQIKEYEELLASVRANNHQQKQGLQDSSSKCQALEENNLSLRHTLSDMEYRLKELEYCKRNLEQENQNLRMQVSETCTGPMLQAKMDEIGNHYTEMVKNLRMEKDREICRLR
uniref:POF1B actin binding protein n=1 Tax=Rhinopithecus bieti TaxID=61621 RepID=A0A2K6MK09_RHIBE